VADDETGLATLLLIEGTKPFWTIGIEKRAPAPKPSPA
jgi:hypothetical protein